MEDSPQYELTFIVSGVLNEQQTENTVNQVRNAIDEVGGEIVELNEWGSQRLAYQIDKKRSGHYVTVFFDAPGDGISSIERTLKINDDILRFLTLRMDSKMQRHYHKKGPEIKPMSEEEETAEDEE